MRYLVKVIYEDRGITAASVSQKNKGSIMAFEEKQIPVRKGGDVIGHANIREYSADAEGLKDAVGIEGLENVIQLINSQIRIVEAGKVRSGQDLVKKAEDALKGLSPEQLSELLRRRTAAQKGEQEE